MALNDETAVRSTSLGLGAALRRAWVGYQLRLDRAMADAGFGERRFPDDRVLRASSGETGATISAIGRELGITRQGATKVVADLRDRGFVVVTDSKTSQREKSVALTARGTDYLALRPWWPTRLRISWRVSSGSRRSLRWGHCSTRWTPVRRCACAPICVARPASSRVRKRGHLPWAGSHGLVIGLPLDEGNPITVHRSTPAGSLVSEWLAATRVLPARSNQLGGLKGMDGRPRWR